MKTTFRAPYLFTYEEACLALAVPRSKLESLVPAGDLRSLRLGYRTLRSARAEFDAIVTRRWRRRP